MSIAVEHENIEIVVNLIKGNSANVIIYVRKRLGQSKFSINERLMFMAIHSRNVEIVELLLQKESIE